MLARSRRIPVSLLVLGLVAGCTLICVFKVGISQKILLLTNDLFHNKSQRVYDDKCTLPQRHQIQSVPGDRVKLPRDMLPLDPHVQEKLKMLSGPSIQQDNLELVKFLQEEMIESPRPFVPKRSGLLYKTPQAEEVDKILKGKVSEAILINLRPTNVFDIMDQL